MGRMTTSINAIKRMLDQISDLDGLAADLIEIEEKHFMDLIEFFETNFMNQEE